MKKKIKIPPLSIIVATDNAGGFGKDGKIPWNIPEDMKHFKEITTGGICIMGRKTHEDMLNMVSARKEKAGDTTVISDILPNRSSFVITSNNKYDAVGAKTATGIRQVIETLDFNDTRRIFIIGGQQMFIEGLSWTHTIHMTIVKDKHFDCDKKFPIEVLGKQYKIFAAQETEELYFVTYQRIR